MIPQSPHRFHLPATRPSLTHKETACGIEFFTTVSFLEDDKSCNPAEVFVRLGKRGDIVGGVVDGLCVAVSVGLQHGVPWEALRKHFQGHKFGQEDGRLAPGGGPLYTSILDAIAKVVDHLIEERRKIVGLDEPPSVPAKPSPPTTDPGSAGAAVPSKPKPTAPAASAAAVANA